MLIIYPFTHPNNSLPCYSKSRYADSPSSLYSLRKMQLDSIVEHNESDESPDKDGGIGMSGSDDLEEQQPPTPQQQHFNYDDSSSAVIWPDFMTKGGMSVEEDGSHVSSSPRFSLPQYLTDEGSVGSYSTSNSGWTTDSRRGSFSSYSSPAAHRKKFVTTERLAKFEQEQEQLFQQKKNHMERELSSVLERNAVKSVRDM